jgi:chromosome segregation ATPase
MSLPPVAKTLARHRGEAIRGTKKEHEAFTQLGLVISQLQRQNDAMATRPSPLETHLNELIPLLESAVAVGTRRASRIRRYDELIAALSTSAAGLARDLAETRAENADLQAEIDALDEPIANGKQWKAQVLETQQQLDALMAERSAQFNEDSQKLIAMLQPGALQSSLSLEADDGPPLPATAEEVGVRGQADVANEKSSSDSEAFG